MTWIESRIPMKNHHPDHPLGLALRQLALATTVAAALSLGTTQAAINVGATSAASFTFDAAPTVANGWSTKTAWTGAPGDITDAASMDAAVQLLNATDVATALTSSTTWPPSTSALVRFNGNRLVLQSNPTTAVKGNLLMATLQNTSGGAINQLDIAYDFFKQTSGTEELAGLRCYYSTTGLAGSWTLIPSLCASTTGTLSALLTFGTPWADTTNMYILWADDASAAAGDSYLIDNVIFSRGADIKSFGLPNTLATVTGTKFPNFLNTDITWWVPAATDVTTLAPTITLSGSASVVPASNVPQDFTNPVQYVVTAGDPLITKTYTVTVVVGPVPVPVSNATTYYEPADPSQGVNIDVAVGSATTAILVGFTQTDWHAGCTKNVILNSNTLKAYFGGNQRTVSGAISGTGVLNIGSTGAAPGTTYSGSAGNTYDAPTTISGTVTLNKTAGDALRGTITMNNAASKMIWGASNQLNDASNLSLTVAGASLDISAKQDTINDLYLMSQGAVQTTVQTGAGGILKVARLFINGTQQPNVAYAAGNGYVLGTGYIDVGNSGPPVIATVPDKPASPSPTSGTTGLHPMFVTLLNWADAAGATSYDVYLWDASGPKPGTPTATVSLSQYAPTLPLNQNATYNWQVVAQNAVGPTNGDVWTFTTTDASYVSNVLTPWCEGGGVRIDTFIPSGVTAFLVGLTQTQWGSGGFSRAVNLNGNTLILDSGGGNYANYAGPISGAGTVTIQNNGQTIGGSLGNTYTGTTNVNTVLTLNKSSGNALCGAITGTGAVITWAANEQINDTSSVTLASGSSLALAGHTETIASLTLATGTSVNTGTGGLLTVTTLTVGGTVQPSGTYTAGNSAWVTGTGSVVVPLVGTPYEIWANTHGITGTASDDDNHNGVANGLEYFMGPTATVASVNPPVVTTGGVMTVTWPRDPSATVTSVKVQYSSDLAIWTDVNVFPPSDPPDPSIDTTTDPAKIVYTLPSTGTKQFCRLVVIP